VSDSQTHSFAPFIPENLGREWKVAFGNWAVEDGRLTHVLPSGPDPTGSMMISGGGMGEVDVLSHLGGITFSFPDGGVETVELQLDMSLQRAEPASVSLDEWGIEWGPYYAMKPVLLDILNAVKAHEYDDEPWGEIGPDTTHRININGDANAIVISVDGREYFRVDRSVPRPYRKISVDTFAGAAISNVSIETSAPQPARVPKKTGPQPILAAVVDFVDDMIYQPFTAEMIDLLIGQLGELGISRVYWFNNRRIRMEAVGPDADPELDRNLDLCDFAAEIRPDGMRVVPATVRNCYPFLPKAVEAGHRRGMEVYAVHKSVDLGWDPPYGDPSPYTFDHFRQTNRDTALVHWHPDAEINEDPGGRPVTSISFFKDNAADHAIRPEDITVWVSDDNESYRPVTPPPQISLGTESRQFARHWEGGQTEPRSVSTITINGLDIRTRYFAVTVSCKRECSFRNLMHRLCEVRDADGRVIHTSRNIPERPTVGPEQWQGQGSFIFNGTTTIRQPSGSTNDRDWIDTYQALDGLDLGLAFMRGRPEYISSGAPSPAHPATIQFWDDWITEALDAGVDGIDLRIINHGRVLDWANYGFGPHERREFETRFGHPLRPDAACREQHTGMLGDMYTDFLRHAAGRVHDAGGKFQHHVSIPMFAAPGCRPMLNIKWDWRRWIEEGIVDTITLKNMDQSPGYLDEAIAHADACGVETILCPYLNCVFSASNSWADQLREVIRGVTARGINGLALYESASFLQADGHGDIKCMLPGMKDVLSGA